jgi:hypothetical protein
MSTYTDALVERIGARVQRLDRALADVEERAALEARADADRFINRVEERNRRRDEKQKKFQARYDSAYRAHGLAGAPPPGEGEDSERYRDRLAAGLQRRLPDGHALKDVDFGDLGYDVMRNLEPQLIADAEAEAAEPSLSNLPRDGSMVERHVTDSATGTRMNKFYGRESFIRQLSRPARRIARIINPNRMEVIWGAPFSRPPT